MNSPIFSFVSLDISPSFSIDMPTVLDANASACILSTVSPARTDATSNSLAHRADAIDKDAIAAPAIAADATAAFPILDKE